MWSKFCNHSLKVLFESLYLITSKEFDISDPGLLSRAEQELQREDVFNPAEPARVNGQQDNAREMGEN